MESGLLCLGSGLRQMRGAVPKALKKRLGYFSSPKGKVNKRKLSLSTWVELVAKEVVFKV